MEKGTEETNRRERGGRREEHEGKPMKNNEISVEKKLRFYKWMTVIVLFLFSLSVIDSWQYLMLRQIRGGDVEVSGRVLRIPWNYYWIRETPNKILVIDAIHGFECAEISALNTLPELERVREKTLEANDCYRRFSFAGHQLVEFQVSLEDPNQPTGESQVILIEDDYILIHYFGRLSAKYEFLLSLLEGDLSKEMYSPATETNPPTTKTP